jgi:hypothetical protein
MKDEMFFQVYAPSLVWAETLLKFFHYSCPIPGLGWGSFILHTSYFSLDLTFVGAICAYPSELMKGSKAIRRARLIA